MPPQESTLRTLRAQLANLHNTLQLSRHRLQTEAAASVDPQPPRSDDDNPSNSEPDVDRGQRLLDAIDLQRGEALLNETFARLTRLEEFAGLAGVDDDTLQVEGEEDVETLERVIEVIMEGNGALERALEEREIRHPLLTARFRAPRTVERRGRGRGRRGSTRNTGRGDGQGIEEGIVEGMNAPEEAVDVAMTEDNGQADAESPSEDDSNDNSYFASPTADWANQFISDNIDRLGLPATLTQNDTPMTEVDNDNPMTEESDPTPPTTSSSSAALVTPATPATPATPGSGSIMGIDDEMREARNRRWEELRRRLSRHERENGGEDGG